MVPFFDTCKPMPRRPPRQRRGAAIKLVQTNKNKETISNNNGTTCTKRHYKNYVNVPLKEVVPAEMSRENKKRMSDHVFDSSLRSSSSSSSSKSESESLLKSRSPNLKQQKQTHHSQCTYNNELKKACHRQYYSKYYVNKKMKKKMENMEIIRKQQLQKQREAARIAIDAIEKTVEFNDHRYVMNEFRKLIGLSH